MVYDKTDASRKDINSSSGEMQSKTNTLPSSCFLHAHRIVFITFCIFAAEGCISKFSHKASWKTLV